MVPTGAGDAVNAANREAEESILAGFITEQEYAQQRGVSLRTCQRDRALRKSPPFCIVGKQVFYRVAAVRAWLLQQERSFEVPTTFRRQK